MAHFPTLQAAFDAFLHHYGQRLPDVAPLHLQQKTLVKTIFQVQSPALKPGNYPTIFHHGQPTPNVIVLTHGLSDSPHYMQAVGKRFYEAGFNVVFPLLPAHGLVHPDEAFEDPDLDKKWRKEIEMGVRIAQQLGKRVSVGGFSTGGALSYNYLLRHPGNIDGGLFLFSAALAIPVVMSATLTRSKLIQLVTKMKDGTVDGVGRDPFKYPDFPYFGVVELGQIIAENDRLAAEQPPLAYPVFAAHSTDDASAKLEGIIHLLEKHCENGTAFLICEKVEHAELPLDADITLDLNHAQGPESPPRANPQFDRMMDSALQFFRAQFADE